MARNRKRSQGKLKTGAKKGRRSAKRSYPHYPSGRPPGLSATFSLSPAKR